MRVFIAIDIDEHIKSSLQQLQQKFAASCNTSNKDVKWVRPEAMHLTLKFLGEIKDEKTVEICNISKDVASRHKSFDLHVESVGHFGGRSARVVWIGLSDRANQLCELQSDLERQLSSAGWREDSRQFKGHLTLCRIKNTKTGIKLAEKTKELENFRAGITPADTLVVYQSKLTSQGPVYTKLGSYIFSAGFG